MLRVLDGHDNAYGPKNTTNSEIGKVNSYNGARDYIRWGDYRKLTGIELALYANQIARIEEYIKQVEKEQEKNGK